MHQSINLYRPPIEQKTLLSARQIFVINLIFIGILFLASIYLGYEYYQTAKELQELETKQANLNKGLENVQKKVPTEEEKVAMEAQIKLLEQTKENSKKMFITLSQLKYQESKGLSMYFRALAQSTGEDMWVKKFHVFNAGNSFLLEGVTTHSSAIPIYVKALGTTEAFKNKNFARVQLDLDSETNLINFILGT